MLRHYFVLSLKVLARRKFFTFISIFGISFTLMVLMVVTALLDHAFGPMPPERHQRRTLELTLVQFSSPTEAMMSRPGFRLVDTYARDLPGVERLSLYTADETVDSYVRGEKIRSSLKRTDAEFWRILDFDFVEGGPYTTDDVDNARFVAVINRTTRERFFGDASAVGETIETGRQTFRVVGVVEDVSELRLTPFADIWVPFTTATGNYRQGLLSGSFGALALARSRHELPRIREEFNSRVARIDLADAGQAGGLAVRAGEQATLLAPFETRFAAVARMLGMLAGGASSPDSQAWRLALLLGITGGLFALLPAVNLVNINLSRVMERTSEIGVRRAFGASRRSLLAQFLFENVVLTLAGGAVGLLVSAIVLRAFNESGIVRYADVGLNLRVFVYGVLLALAFGIVSGVYPAWRMARLCPAAALRGGERR